MQFLISFFHGETKFYCPKPGFLISNRFCSHHHHYEPLAMNFAKCLLIIDAYWLSIRFFGSSSVSSGTWIWYEYLYNSFILSKLTKLVIDWQCLQNCIESRAQHLFLQDNASEEHWSWLFWPLSRIEAVANFEPMFNGMFVFQKDAVVKFDLGGKNRKSSRVRR